MKRTILNAMITTALVSSFTANATIEDNLLGTITIRGEAGLTYSLEAMDQQIASQGVELMEHKTAIATNSDNIQTNAQQINDNRAHADLALQNEVSRAIGVEAKHTVELNDHETRLVGMKQNVDDNTKDIATNRAEIATNASIIQSAVDASATAINNVNTVKQEQTKTNQRVASHNAELANHEQRIQELEAKDTVNFGKLQDEVNENRQRASAAISGVAAMANIPQVIQGQTLAVGAGMGTTDGESALAVGFSARATEHVIVKASVSDDSQQNFVVGGGVAYGW